MSKKLLLADDSVTIQKVVNLTFADEGIEVITAGDGDAAMQMLFETAPDLVMADVNMPGLNGYQVCEQIKQNENLKNTPVILLVGSFEPFDEDEARRVGADDFLTKPFQSIRQLVNKVSTLLESAANGETAAAKTASSLAETQEFDKPEMPAESLPPVEYGDAGMDDEMIQSNSSAGFAFDESQKFSSRSYEETTEDDLQKTQPLSAADWREIAAPDEAFAAAAAETVAPVETYESRNEVSFEEEYTSPPPAPAEEFPTAEETAAPAEEMPQPESASLLQFDDDDFLELPPLFEDEETAPPPVQPALTETRSAERVVETARFEEIKTVHTVETAEAGAHLSAVDLDEIVRRVVERMSDKAVREIAWEVVPQQAELIIKKMVEEKLRE